jgi:hypothetical protein
MNFAYLPLVATDMVRRMRSHQMSRAVFFFGGWNAIQAHIDAWVRSAHQKQPGITFTGYPYPSGAGWDYKSAINSSTKLRASAVTAIQACKADAIYIVGHSSGCAISNAVDKALKDTSKIHLVALDGFAPDEDQRKRPTTQVWAAWSGDAKSKINKSLHYDDLEPLLKSSLQKYQALTECTTKLALHFSLVNAHATDTRVTSIATGYTDCEANLAWL